MDESLRLKIIGDPSGAITSLNQVNAVAAATVSGMRTSFMELGSVIKGAVGWVAGFAAIKKGVELASTQEGLLRTQTNILKNQGALGTQLAGTMGKIAGTSDKYSTTLAQQAMQLSTQTGISLNQITQAQNLLIPNSDLLNLYQKQSGAFGDVTKAAANLSSLMGGNMVASSRVLARTLADPAKKMSSLTRYGFSLNKQQQSQLKATNGLLQQQELFVKDINSTLGGTAQAAIPPIQKLANDFNNILMDLGKGFEPIIASFAEVLGTPAFIDGIDQAMTTMATAISDVSMTMGTTLGNMMTAMTPLLNILTQGILPAIMNVVQPFVVAAATILSNIQKTLGNTAVKETVTLISTLAATLIHDIHPTLTLLVKTFDQMTGKGGALTQFFQNLVQSLAIMAPLLPAIVNLFAQLIVLSLPMMQTMLPVMAVIIRFVASIAAGIGHVLDFARKVIGPFHAIFTGIAMAVGVVAAVWFTRHLFIDPIRAAIAQIRSLTSYFLKMGIIGKEAFAGLRGEKGMAGGLHGLGQGRARAEQYLLEQQAGMRFSKGEINARGYRREMRRISMQGPVFEEELKRLRRTSNPLYGKAFGGEGGNLLSRLRTTLLGPNKQVLEGLMNTSKRFEEGEDENIVALNKNTEAILTLHSKMSGTNRAASQLSGYEALHENLSRSPGSAHNPYVQGLEGLRGNLAAKEAEQAVAKSGFLSRIAGRFSGGIFGRVGGMFGGIRGKIGGMGMLGKGLMGGAAGLATMVAGPLIAKMLPKSISGVANSALGGASMGMMFGPWGAAIGAAVGALTNLFQTCKPFHKFVMDTANLIQKWAIRIWKDVLPALKIIGKIIKTVILTSVKLIILEFKIWWAVIKTVWNVLVAIGKFIWNVLVAYVKMYVQAWKDVYNAVMWVWHGIVNGGKMVWGWLKSAFDWLSNAGKWVWANLYNGFVSVANMIISAWNSTLGGILGAIGIDVKVTKLTAMKVPKFHSGGIVPGSPGKEVPAILQAGETVLSMSQTRARANAGGGGQLAVHPGAVVININGSADDKVAAQIKSHVEGQFKELHRTLKGMGR